MKLPQAEEQVLLKSTECANPQEATVLKHIRSKIALLREMERETVGEKRTKNSKQAAEGMKCWITVPWLFYVHNSTENMFS